MEKKTISDYCTKIEVTKAIRLDLFTDTMFRVRISGLAGEAFPPQYEIPFAVGKTSPWQKVDYTTDTRDSTMLQVYTKALAIYVRKDTGTFMVETRDGVRLYPEAAPRYGMFCNHCVVFDSASFHREDTSCSRYAHWFYSRQSGSYDVYLSEDALSDTFFLYGKTYRDCYAQFNTLVGAEPLLPRKGYGYYQTQHLGGKGTQALLMRTAEQLRKRDIPCDTLILDLEWGDGANGGTEVPWGTRLEWSDRYASPLTPAQMVAKLKEMNFDVMVIHHSIPAYDGRSDEGWVCAEFPADVWWEKMQELLDIGVAGTWQDTRQTDITNARIYAELERRTNKRVSMLCNYDVYRDSSWTKDCVMIPYKQRVGGRRMPFSWTGDMSLDKWSELSFQVKSIVGEQGALKGISYLTNDALRPGGKELAMRGDQFLCFNSVARSHNHKPWQTSESAAEFAESIAIGKEKGAAREKTDEDLLGLTCEDAEQEANARKYLKLRYRLFPYLYTAARQAYDTGFPVTRPLMIAFEEDQNCSGNKYRTEYMFGENILVCPVCEKVRSRNVYFPAGQDWIGFFDGSRHPGGREEEIDVSDPQYLPLFVKAGSVIPMREECCHLGEQGGRLYLHIFGEGESEFSLYEDDGESLLYRDGECAFTRIRSLSEGDRLRLVIGAAEGNYRGKPPRREITAVWHGRNQLPKNELAGGRVYTDGGTLVAEFSADADQSREIVFEF